MITAVIILVIITGAALIIVANHHARVQRVRTKHDRYWQ